MTDYDPAKDSYESFNLCVSSLRERLEKSRVVIGDCTLYEGDCRDILPTLHSIDAVVTDPPYGVGLEYASHDDSELVNWLDAARAVAPLVMFTPGVANAMKFPQADWIFAWLKPNSMKRVATGFNTWEPVLVYGKIKGKKTHDTFTVCISGQDDTGDHPCPKPVPWAKELIIRATSPGQVVCDPFAGTGTTGIAAVKLGRKFIGIEIDPQYFDIACRRIEEAYRQPDFFVSAPEKKPEQMSLV